MLQEQLKSIAANRGANPDTLFEDTVTAALWQNHFRKRPLSEELIKEMSLEKSFAFYKDRFADASDFTFVLKFLKRGLSRPITFRVASTDHGAIEGESAAAGVDASHVHRRREQ